MLTIIAGGRDYLLTPADEAWLDTLGITEVVSGCATGADQCGIHWAVQRGLPIHRFPADWTKYGKAAGPIRNTEMARFAEALAIFPGRSGTRHMLTQAIRYGLKVFDRNDAGKTAYQIAIEKSQQAAAEYKRVSPEFNSQKIQRPPPVELNKVTLNPTAPKHKWMQYEPPK